MLLRWIKVIVFPAVCEGALSCKRHNHPASFEGAYDELRQQGSLVFPHIGLSFGLGLVVMYPGLLVCHDVLEKA